MLFQDQPLASQHVTYLATAGPRPALFLSEGVDNPGPHCADRPGASAGPALLHATQPQGFKASALNSMDMAGGTKAALLLAKRAVQMLGLLPALPSLVGRGGALESNITTRPAEPRKTEALSRRADWS